jgi:flagellar motor component MotA
MTPFAQILAAIITGIVSLGLLIFILRQIFSQLDGKADKSVVTQLDNKVDKNVFEEHCKRIDGLLVAGSKKFDEIQASLKENTQQMHVLCKEIVKLQEHIGEMEKKLP